MRVVYDKLVPALKEHLPAEVLDLLGRSVRFILRLRELQASLFVWAVVLSRFGSERPGFEQARQWYQRLGGHKFFPRPFQMRFKCAAAVTLFEKSFEQAVAPWQDPRRRRAQHPLTRKFPDIVAWDSSWIQLADELRKVFKGTHGMKAAIKVALAVSVFGLLPLFGQVVPANVHDMLLFPPLELFRAGTLLLFDKGFVAYDRLRQLQRAQLRYLCPMRLDGNPTVVAVRRAPAYVRKALKARPQGVKLRTLLPKRRKLHQAWDIDVLVTPRKAKDRTPVRTRLVITPGRKREQHPYLTNLLPVEWTPAMLRELYRLRWQIELVFKELKQHLNLEVLPSTDRHAIQIFAWASLIALVVSRAVTAWLFPIVRLVGLASKIRPILMTRALRATVRILARALLAPPRKALTLLEVFTEEILSEVRALNAEREDSFRRLIPMLSDGESA